MITIGELARFAGVTVKTVRHYHARGLLAEPERDASGYRRYEAQAVVDLIRIRTLAEAGVPLGRVGELLSADAASFATAVEEIDRDLVRRIARMERNRNRVRQLVDAESLAVPGFVREYLGLLRGAGLSEAMVEIEREGWILLCVRYPDRVEDWIRTKAQSLNDDGYLRLYRMLDRTWDWSPDDPRLADLVDEFAAHSANSERQHPADDPAAPQQEEFDEVTTALLDSQTLAKVPAWRSLTRLLQQRDLLDQIANRAAE